MLVTANSHATIENVLFMIEKKLGPYKDISLYKASKWSDGSYGKKGIIEIVNDDIKYSTGATIYDHMTGDDLNRPLVMGATNWSCHKMKKAVNAKVFHLIIMDEASQVRVMDAMCALTMGDPERSRYLIVGDEDQLPAIFQGRYGKDSEESYKYGSVFDFFKEGLKKADIDIPELVLNDNFRMNEILLRYSAEKIYGEKYTSFNANIAGRRLSYLENISENRDHAMIRYIFDDFSKDDEKYWPLIFCRISGGTPNEQRSRGKNSRAARKSFARVGKCQR